MAPPPPRSIFGVRLRRWAAALVSFHRGRAPDAYLPALLLRPPPFLVHLRRPPTGPFLLAAAQLLVVLLLLVPPLVRLYPPWAGFYPWAGPALPLELLRALGHHPWAGSVLAAPLGWAPLLFSPLTALVELGEWWAALGQPLPDRPAVAFRFWLWLPPTLIYLLWGDRYSVGLWLGTDGLLPLLHGLPPTTLALLLLVGPLPPLLRAVRRLRRFRDLQDRSVAEVAATDRTELSFGDRRHHPALPLQLEYSHLARQEVDEEEEEQKQTLDAELDQMTYRTPASFERSRRLVTEGPLLVQEWSAALGVPVRLLAAAVLSPWLLVGPLWHLQRRTLAVHRWPGLLLLRLWWWTATLYPFRRPLSRLLAYPLPAARRLRDEDLPLAEEWVDGWGLQAYASIQLWILEEMYYDSDAHLLLGLPGGELYEGERWERDRFRRLQLPEAAHSLLGAALRRSVAVLLLPAVHFWRWVWGPLGELVRPLPVYDRLGRLLLPAVRTGRRLAGRLRRPLGRLLARLHPSPILDRLAWGPVLWTRRHPPAAVAAGPGRGWLAPLARSAPLRRWLDYGRLRSQTLHWAAPWLENLPTLAALAAVLSPAGLALASTFRGWGPPVWGELWLFLTLLLVPWLLFPAFRRWCYWDAREFAFPALALTLLLRQLYRHHLPLFGPIHHGFLFLLANPVAVAARPLGPLWGGLLQLAAALGAALAPLAGVLAVPVLPFRLFWALVKLTVLDPLRLLGGRLAGLGEPLWRPVELWWWYGGRPVLARLLDPLASLAAAAHMWWVALPSVLLLLWLGRLVVHMAMVSFCQSPTDPWLNPLNPFLGRGWPRACHQRRLWLLRPGPHRDHPWARPFGPYTGPYWRRFGRGGYRLITLYEGPPAFWRRVQPATTTHRGSIRIRALPPWPLVSQQPLPYGYERLAAFARFSKLTPRWWSALGLAPYPPDPPQSPSYYGRLRRPRPPLSHAHR